MPPKPRHFRLFLSTLLALAFTQARVAAHDIPNARVDRSIQVLVEPSLLKIHYEVSLSELTLTQELRALIGELPGADRRAWFAAYGKETGPLDAKGFLVEVDSQPVALKVEGFDLVVEEHPRFLFHFMGPIPTSGRLSVLDTNYRTSEGTSRLAVKGRGVLLGGDDQPADVSEIPERPIWQLSDAEERRTRQVSIEYQLDREIPIVGVLPRTTSPSRVSFASLSRLFDQTSTRSLGLLCLIALGSGAIHALQPGHGKTLVVATMLTEHSRLTQGTLLAMITTLTHTGSVLVVAACLWWTNSLRFPEVHLILTRGSGFVIAAIGFWRLGCILGRGSAEKDGYHEPQLNRNGSLLGIGIAGGIVPCWDAVGLIVLSAALNKVGLGLALVASFSLGMGSVLVLVGILATSFRWSRPLSSGSGRAEPALSVVSGLFLAAIGVYLLST